mmetsp:Transcript_10309/g.34484  ORF Transcript_10309/g.34484 Transcript_10309/m.34484 type:complete len:212 (+) Transcript_10309:21-656(+)
MLFLLLLAGMLASGILAEPQVTHRVFMELSIGGEPAGRLEIGLFGEHAPKTVENFLGVIKGFTSKGSGKSLGLRGSKLHRIIPGAGWGYYSRRWARRRFHLGRRVRRRVLSLQTLPCWPRLNGQRGSEYEQVFAPPSNARAHAAHLCTHAPRPAAPPASGLSSSSLSRLRRTSTASTWYSARWRAFLRRAAIPSWPSSRPSARVEAGPRPR